MQNAHMELNADQLDGVTGGGTVGEVAKAVGRRLNVAVSVAELGWEALKALTKLGAAIDKDLRKNGHPTNGNLEGS